MTKLLKNLTQILINEINKLIGNIENSIKNQDEINEVYIDDENDSNKKRLKKQEIWYDKMYEKYLEVVKLISNEQSFKILLKQFQEKVQQYFNQWKREKETIGNNLDNFLLNEIIKTEKQLMANEFTEEFETMNYQKYVIHQENWKNYKEKERKEEEKQLRRQIEEQNLEYRKSIVKNELSSDQMMMIEMQMCQMIHTKIFDSSMNYWNKNNSDFFRRIQNKSGLVILIETTEGIKFGCYIERKINKQNSYIEDPNAFVFKIDKNRIEKYYVIDSKNAIKICDDRDDNLFIVGYNRALFGQDGDIVIKKRDKKDRCSCSQKSFDYHGLENALIGRKGIFEVKNICVYDIFKEEEYHQMIENEIKMEMKHKDDLKRWKSLDVIKTQLNMDQFNVLEEWTKSKCSHILFDSNVHDWKQNTSVFNDRIIGKKQLTFLIENEDGELFGYYLNTQIVEEYDKRQETDSNSFEFNLKSKNNRLNKMKKYDIKDLKWGGICLCVKNWVGLVKLGDIELYKENKKNESHCNQYKDRFNYDLNSNALCENKYFDPKRILVIQMN